MKHKACRRMAPVLQAREMASRNLHTAEVGGSIPVAPTTQKPLGRLWKRRRPKGFRLYGDLPATPYLYTPDHAKSCRYVDHAWTRSGLEGMPDMSETAKTATAEELTEYLAEWVEGTFSNRSWGCMSTSMSSGRGTGCSR